MAFPFDCPVGAFAPHRNRFPWTAEKDPHHG